MKNIRRVPLALCVMACIAIGVGLVGGRAVGQVSWSGGSAKFTEDRSSTAPHQTHKPLVVETFNGRVSVSRGGTDAVTITARIRASSEERLAAVKITSERDAGGTLRVGVQWPGGARESNEGCGLDIVLPDASSIDVRSANGAIDVSGITAPCTLRTSNGPIDVRGINADLVATTSNGAITARALGGTLQASTSNGAVVADGVKGHVNVETSNGEVSVRMTSSAAGPARIKTSNGAISLWIGRAFVGTLHASTTNGAVTIKAQGAEPAGKITRTQGTWKFGDAQIESELVTRNGSISVESVPEQASGE